MWMTSRDLCLYDGYHEELYWTLRVQIEKGVILSKIVSIETNGEGFKNIAGDRAFYRKKRFFEVNNALSMITEMFEDMKTHTNYSTRANIHKYARLRDLLAHIIKVEKEENEHKECGDNRELSGQEQSSISRTDVPGSHDKILHLEKQYR